MGKEYNFYQQPNKALSINLSVILSKVFTCLGSEVDELKQVSSFLNSIFLPDFRS